MPPDVVVRRAGDRATTRLPGFDSRHAFSFGAHYDPTNVGYGLLVAHNEELLAPGAGFGSHPHRDVEIVTWVLAGSLAHEDSTGRRGLIGPGQVQRLTAGSGVRHSEGNAPGETASLHLVQMWIQPDEPGLAPAYEQRSIEPAALDGRLVPLASGLARHRLDPVLRIAQPAAALHATRLGPGQAVALPAARLVHVHVARGAVDLEPGIGLAAGDAARVTGSDGQRLTGLVAGTEVLVWEMHAAR